MSERFRQVMSPDKRELLFIVAGLVGVFLLIVGISLTTPILPLSAVLTITHGFLLVFIIIAAVSRLLSFMISEFTDRHAYLTISAYVINALAAICFATVGTVFFGEGIAIVSDDPRAFDAIGWEFAQYWAGQTVFTLPTSGLWTEFGMFHPSDTTLIHLIYASIYYLYGREMMIVRFVTAGAAAFLIPLIYFYSRTVFSKVDAYWVSSWARFLPQIVVWSASPNRVTLWTVALLVGLSPTVLLGSDRVSTRQILLSGVGVTLSALFLYASERRIIYLLAAVLFTVTVSVALTRVSELSRLDSLTYRVSLPARRWQPLIASLFIVSLPVGLTVFWQEFARVFIPLSPPRHGCTVPTDFTNANCLFEFTSRQLLEPSPLWILTVPSLFAAVFFPMGIIYYLALPVFILGSLKLVQRDGVTTPVVFLSWMLLLGNAVVWWLYSIGTVRYRALAWPFIFIILSYGYIHLVRHRTLTLTDRIALSIPALFVVLCSMVYLVSF